MLYSDYKTASERHYEVCLQLQSISEGYKLKEATKPLSVREEKDKMRILSNLYYLSGYIIECSYNCSIYKYLGWTSDVARLTVADTPHNVTCYPPGRSSTGTAAFIIRRSGPGLKQHQLSGNMHFFQTVCPITVASSIPLIGYDVPSRLSYDLFDNWNAEIRYLVDPSLNLNYDKVFDFFFLAVEIYEGLLKNSMI